MNAGVRRLRVLLADAGRFCQVLLSASRLLLVPQILRLLRRPLTNREVGRRLRLFLEGGGVVTRKLGQFLAMRFDVFPSEICSELDLLFDSVAPMSSEIVRKAVESELGASLESTFTAFNFEPIASASVAQVHRATARDGQILAVKIQRVGIQEQFQSVIRNLRRLTSLSDLVNLTGSVSAREILDEFAEFTAREFDFVEEGNTADRLRAGMISSGYVPEIRWDLTTSRVLAMEFASGISVLTICRLHEAGKDEEIERLLPSVDLLKTIEQIAYESFHELFDNNFFHGDPHPANILIRPDGSFVFLDCGIFGELSGEDLTHLTAYLQALAADHDFLRSARSYLSLCQPTARTRLPELEQALAKVLEAWVRTLQDPNAPLERRHISVWQGVILDLLRRHHVRTKRNLLLVWRAWMFLDATVIRLPIQFDVLAAQARFFRRRHAREVMLGFLPSRYQGAVANQWLNFVGVVRSRGDELSMEANHSLTPAQVHYADRRGRWVALTVLLVSFSLLSAGALSTAGARVSRIALRVAGILSTQYVPPVHKKK